MKIVEYVLGFILILALLMFGKNYLNPDSLLFFRLLIGLAFGYTLARAYTGFAGSVNRAYRAGSTKLMRSTMIMFFLTALIVAGLVYGSGVSSYSLWINPINLGLLLGAFLFGFGMSISACCATGVLTDLSVGFSRAFVTLIFWCAGVFLGFPIQETASWVNDSWFVSSTGADIGNGVFLPDWFKGDGFEGFLGALLLIAVFCAIVFFVSKSYEKKRVERGDYGTVDEEFTQETECEEIKLDPRNFKVFSEETYKYIFARPWSLKQGALVLVLLFVLLMVVTGSGWGASTPFGIWFGKLLMLFGVSAEAIAEFTNKSTGFFTQPFFEHQISVQNFGIILGAVVYLLTAGKFKDMFVSSLSITGKEVFLFALGGLTMGFGTRLANGCNVGALYTPLSNFSLSGWIFLVFMILGAIVSNKLIYDKFLKANTLEQGEKQLGV